MTTLTTLSRSCACAALLLAGTVGLSETAQAAPPQPIEFVEAVHNLGYIDLYVGQHAKIFEKHGLTLHLTAAGGDTQAWFGDFHAGVAGATQTGIFGEIPN